VYGEAKSESIRNVYKGLKRVTCGIIGRYSANIGGNAMYDAIVIGGGVVGASAAYHLALGKAKTLLIDRRDAGRATDAGAGIVAPATSGTAIPGDWFHFAVAAGEYYPVLIERLKDEDAGDTGYRVCGELLVAADADELGAYETKKQIIFERQAWRGLPHPDDLHEISSDDARELFPALKPILKALYFRHGARVDGRLLEAALLKAASHRPLEVQHQGVRQLIIENEHITGVIAEGITYRAEKIIIAGGAWSSAFGEQLGCAIPVEPQRGQIIHMYLTGTNTGDWPVVEAFHGHYLVCWPQDRVVAGATREVGSGFEPHTTISGVHEVLGEAIRVAPGLKSAVLGEVRVGLRPRTLDNLPVMGSVPGVEGVYLATGHGANGLQLGPFSGKVAADWALGHESETDISPFSVTRKMG
jgi:D-amino-acid dehydrogenase